MLTGLAQGFVSLVLARVLLGFGEGATFPAATRAMSNWTAASRRGFAQGITHSWARIGNAITPPLVAALMIALSWRGSFVILGLVSFAWVIVWALYFRDKPRDHPHITQTELSALPREDVSGQRARIPWSPLVRRMWPVTLVYFCYGWTLWLYLSWIPSYFLHSHGLDLKRSVLFASGVFFAGVVGDTLGGVVSDWLVRKTGDLRVARRNLVMIRLLGAAVSLSVAVTRDPRRGCHLLEPRILFRGVDDRPDVGDPDGRGTPLPGHCERPDERGIGPGAISRRSRVAADRPHRQLDAAVQRIDGADGVRRRVCAADAWKGVPRAAEVQDDLTAH
jgi:MFS family permease